jgi:hypothetical protein
MTAEFVVFPCVPIQFSNSPVSFLSLPFQRRVKRASVIAPILDRRGVRRIPNIPPHEGSGAPGDAGVCETPWAAGDAARHALRGVSFPFAITGRRLSALHWRHSFAALAANSAPGPRFLGRGNGPIPVQRAPRGGVIVPPGRFPEPPGAAVTSRSSRRRIRPHLQSVPRRRPSTSRTECVYTPIGMLSSIVGIFFRGPAAALRRAPQEEAVKATSST